MKLATIYPTTKSLNNRDGQLVVVDQMKGCVYLASDNRFPTLLSAIENWGEAKKYLEEIPKNSGSTQLPIDECKFLAPLPRSYAWLDSSAFIQHVILVRKARGAEPPEDLRTVPLMYQGASDNLLGPNDDIPLIDLEHGLDFEGEIAVVTDYVPCGTNATKALEHIKLLLLMNDISLRNLIPREVQTGFGFVQSKPPSSFAPFAITPDECGAHWRDGRLTLELESKLNGKLFGRPNAKEMHFSFGDLIAHAARTRPLSAGTIIGSGTVSNEDEGVGSSCIVERRMLEKIKSGEMKTPYMQPGDTIEMNVLLNGTSLFGSIKQKVKNQ